MSVISYVRSSIGTKQIMGVTGLLMCGFIAAHLAGNLLLFVGKAPFDAYAGQLAAHPEIIIPAELGLIAIVFLHVFAAIRLATKNRSAKPQSYYGSQGPKNISASMMGYTGFLIFVFIIYHLWSFKFSLEEGESLYVLVEKTFSQPHHAGLYVAFMIVLGVHLFHGFQSTFLTLGLDHPKYTPVIRGLGYLYAISMAVGFMAMPIFFYVKASASA